MLEINLIARSNLYFKKSKYTLKKWLTKTEEDIGLILKYTFTSTHLCSTVLAEKSRNRFFERKKSEL